MLFSPQTLQRDRGSHSGAPDGTWSARGDQSCSSCSSTCWRGRRSPKVLFRLQALSPDLLQRQLIASSDPNDSEFSLRVAVLNYTLVPDLNLASVTTQPHTIVRDVESIGEMGIFTPGDPNSYWYDRFGSLRPPFACTKSRHVPPSLRVDRRLRHHLPDTADRIPN